MSKGCGGHGRNIKKIGGTLSMDKKTLKWLAVAVWMGVIFIYSNQPAVVSSEKSGFVIEMFKALGLNLNSIFGDLASFVVRKTAHFTEYFILYILVYNAVLESKEKKKSLLYSIIIVFLYACSDEIHQIFIPGREGRIKDVMIDTSGGILALIIMAFTKSKETLKRI